MKRFVLALVCLSFLIAPLVNAQSAFLYVAPSKGTFFVGSTFSVSIYLDTKASKINVIELDLKFPPEILQVTTPTAGESFISQWLIPPSYSNIAGTISFKGGIPEGITTSAGLVSTITFRARNPGTAQIEILDSSQIVLADGKGTKVIITSLKGVYDILVLPAEGPEVLSNTHPDTDLWYSNSSPAFLWDKGPSMSDFSFALSQNHRETPDTVSQGNISFVSFDNVSDGIWYFHIRAKENNSWGKASHFPVKIDTTSPEEFRPEIDLSAGFIYFEASDSHSGISHYEISFSDLAKTSASFFVEASSPFRIPFNDPGRYSVIIRAHDRAGNYRDEELIFRIISPIISLIEGKGFRVGRIFLSWPLLYMLMFFMLFTPGYVLSRKKGYAKGIKEIEEALREIRKIDETEKQSQKIKEEFDMERKKLEQELQNKNLDNENL